MIDASYIQSGNWNLVESKKADFDMIQIETKIKNVKKKKRNEFVITGNSIIRG